MAEFLITSLDNIFALQNLLLVNLGLILGAIVGCLPGLTATMALAVLVPFTFNMDPASGLIALGGIYVGAIYGGCISAILINTPGTPSAIATTFDGYPLTLKGRAQEALTTAAFSSSFGGIVGAVLLLLVSPVLAEFALKFGPPEYFWMAVFGLTIIASLAAKSILKGLIGGAIGLLLSTVGMAPIGGDIRFAFGSVHLQSGLELIVALIGFFCIPEIIAMIERRREHYRIAEVKKEKGVSRKVIRSLLRRPGLLLRSSVIGTFVGVIPGAGGSIAALVSYNEARRFSENPEAFGTGIIEGVAASESANNAEVGGSLVPLLTLGIPGAPPAAVLLGVLLLHGMRPGPELYTTFGEITYTFLLSLILANVLLFFVGMYGARAFARLINIPVHFLAPFISFLSVIGSFSIRNNMLDVVVMFFFGIAGYIARKLDFHPGPIVLGLILGPIAENGLVQSLLMGQASGSVVGVLLLRPGSMVLIAMCLLSVLWPFVSARRKVGGETTGEQT